MLFANGGTVKGNINVSSSGFGIGSLFSENDLFFPTSAQAHVGLGTTDFPSGMNSSSYAQLKVGGSIFAVSGAGNGSAAFLTNNAYVGSGNNMYLDGGGAASAIQQTQGKISFTTFDGSGGSADSQWSMTNAMTINASRQICFGSAQALDSSNATCGFTPNSNTGAEMIVGRPSSFTGTGNTLLHYHNGSYIGGINTSTSATSFLTSSDYRLKENIKPLENGLSRVINLNPVKFDWKLNSESSEGFIAHEVQAIFPEAISGEKDEERMQGMDYGRITPLLVKAIQEQQVIIEDLKSRIETLEG